MQSHRNTRKKNNKPKDSSEITQVQGLLSDLIERINQKMSGTIVAKRIENRNHKAVIKRTEGVVAYLQSPKARVNPVQSRKGQIRLKGYRDWEGLCSERKEDVLGEYAICFSYAVEEEQEEVLGEEQFSQFQSDIHSSC